MAEKKASSGEALISLRSGIIGYPGTWSLGPIDIEIRRGTFWGIIGPNGAGKTTLLRTLVGLHPLVEGQVNVAASVRQRGAIAYVPQREALDPIFPLSALGVVVMGWAPRRGFGRPFLGSHRHLAVEALDRVGLRHLARRPFRELSGGEQQRTLLARALVGSPEVMLLDEPTAAMDVDAERAVLDLVRSLAEERGLAVLMVSHLLPAVRRHADQVVLLNREHQQIFVGPPDHVLGEAAAEGGDSFRRLANHNANPPGGAS